jgi:hypothetical protein
VSYTVSYTWVSYTWARYLLVAVLLAGLLAAGTESLRMGWADYRMRQATLAGTEGAIALVPGHAEYHARLAALVADNDPNRARAALRQAVALNPWDARSWIELGLLAEADGDGAAAETLLLRAADLDHEYLPGWTLANYYFRHNNTGRFWFWAQRAAAMVYGDPQPLFRLCTLVEPDGKLIDRLQIRNPSLRAWYLSYLLAQNRLDRIGPAVHRVSEQNRAEDVPLLLIACERLLQTGQVDDAAEIWNRQADAGRVPFRTPAGRGEHLVANGTFLASPTSLGFDWRLPVVEGVSISREGELHGLRVTFSGSQPEDCEALVQFVPVWPRMRYHLQSVYRTQGIAAAGGLGWRVTVANSGAALGESLNLASDADAEAGLWFDTPAQCRLVRLALRSHRVPGTTRTDGFLVLRTVDLRPAAQLPIAGSRVSR